MGRCNLWAPPKLINVYLSILRYMKEITTIKLSKRTKKELNSFKVHPREPYEDVIKRLIAGRGIKPFKKSDKGMM